VTTLRAARARLLVLVTAGVVVGEVLAWFLLRSQGNDLGGDQVHYLVAGQALSHLTLNMASAYRADFLSHAIFNWPHGASVTNHAIVQTYPGPHGSVFAHGIGLPLLLSPFLAIGSVPLGLLGLFTLVALGFVCIHQRACALAGVARRGQLLVALLMAAPALWLASTQVYPDLLSGVLLAMALVELALVEQRREVSAFSGVVLAAGLGFVPWLQVKNLAPALCALVIIVVLAVLRPELRRRLGAIAVIPVLGWVLLAAYNQYYFGHLVGLPQPNPTFTLTTAARTLALVFDAHQGLLVQVPTTVIGVVGLWVGRRRIPLTALAALVGALSMVVINGTYTSGVPFGGTALAGRFAWTVVPMLLAWIPLCVAALAAHPRRQLGVALAASALWLAQGLPIVLGDHIYVNSMIAPFAPWDPTLYPGWWPLVGRWLPTFLPPGLRLGATWARLFFELVLLGLCTAVLVRLTRARPFRPSTRTAAAVGVAVVTLAVGVLLPVRSQPLSPLAFTGSDLGAPWSGAGQLLTTAPASLAEVGPGTYRVTLAYAPNPGAQPGRATVMATANPHVVVAGWFTPRHPTDAARLQTAVPTLAAGSGQQAGFDLSARGGRHQRSVRISVTHDSVLSFYVTVGAGSTFAATSLTITKVAA
jgi:hypothetical protein